MNIPHPSKVEFVDPDEPKLVDGEKPKKNDQNCDNNVSNVAFRNIGGAADKPKSIRDYRQSTQQ